MRNQNMPGQRPAAKKMNKNKQKWLAECLRNQIVSGEVLPGDRLPTRQEMIAQFGVSMVTLQRAMDKLRDDGFIATRGRLGSFVADPPPHLCRHALVFPCNAPDQNCNAHPRWSHLARPSRFMEAFLRVATARSIPGETELVCYMGVDRELNTPGYRRLVADIEARRLAGVIFLHPNSSYTPELLAGSGIPCIAYGIDQPLPGAPIFHIDHTAFIDKALDYLVTQGRRRIAMLSISSIGGQIEAHFHAAAAARGFETAAHSMLGLDPYQPQWARNAVAILLNQAPDRRPDGLIVADEHLVPAATQGIVESSLQVPDEIEVVAHCNFVSDDPTAVLVTHLGFDVAAILETCIRLLATQRRGETIPDVTPIEPVFESERTTEVHFYRRT